LYVVATPIGNLDDITVRGLDVLKRVDLIACEDTRTSRVLLQRWGIKARTMSLHRFSEARKTETILECLHRGEQVALLSDAGTPAISDPGARLVLAVLDAGFPVIPIPGPSSITAALSVSGFDASSFVFLGFIPKKLEQKGRLLSALAAEPRTTVFFETPIRILNTLEALAARLGGRRMVLFRELTKLHEESIRGTAAELIEALRKKSVVKGEIVLVIEGAEEPKPDVDLDSAVRSLIAEGLTGKRLATAAAERYGINKGVAYAKFLEIAGLASQRPVRRGKSTGQDPDQG
jgi:16S rRNA (cytidine1402-2'-O)-methyltransferase